ncbi:MAG: hypothetical protein ABR953_10295 [Candidatus Acidiferrales bacterium]
MEQRKTARDWGGRFFGRRVNCEIVPLLPAWIVGRMLDDPRKIPYLLVWADPQDGTPREAVRLCAKIKPPVPFPPDLTDLVEIKRHDGTRNFIGIVLRPLPRNGGQAWLFMCPYCQTPCRALYGWKAGGQYTNSAQISPWWQCRQCAGLRYSSEGGALVLRGRGSWFRALEVEFGTTRSDRPESWYPYVFTSPHQAAAAGIIL